MRPEHLPAPNPINSPRTCRVSSDAPQTQFLARAPLLRLLTRFHSLTCAATRARPSQHVLRIFPITAATAYDNKIAQIPSTSIHAQPSWIKPAPETGEISTKRSKIAISTPIIMEIVEPVAALPSLLVCNARPAMYGTNMFQINFKQKNRNRRFQTKLMAQSPSDQARLSRPPNQRASSIWMLQSRP